MGVLPVNDPSRGGRGFVNFTIRPRADVPPGQELLAQAEIRFDNTAPEALPCRSRYAACTEHDLRAQGPACRS